ncbi:BON domain-containing protein [Lysobacter terrae]
MNTTRHTVIAAAFAISMCALPAYAQGQEREERDTPVEKTTADAAEHVGDAWITTKVKADLMATKGVSGTAIDVDTKDGVVTLNGTVASRAEADKAVAVAKSIHGVTTVKSKLKIAP